MRPGPLPVCPSAGPRGQASSLSPPLPASGLSLPSSPQSPLRVRTCAGPPHEGGEAPGGRRATARAPTPLPAAGARPPVYTLRRSPGERGPGRHLLALSSSRPLPSPARSHRRGARTCSRRAGLHAGGRGSRGSPGRRDKGRGGSRGSRSAAVPAPPAAGEGARRVSAGRYGEAGICLGYGWRDTAPSCSSSP